MGTKPKCCEDIKLSLVLVSSFISSRLYDKEVKAKSTQHFGYRHHCWPFAPAELWDNHSPSWASEWYFTAVGFTQMPAERWVSLLTLCNLWTTGIFYLLIVCSHLLTAHAPDHRKLARFTCCLYSDSVMDQYKKSINLTLISQCVNSVSNFCLIVAEWSQDKNWVLNAWFHWRQKILNFCNKQSWVRFSALYFWWCNTMWLAFQYTFPSVMKSQVGE